MVLAVHKFLYISRISALSFPEQRAPFCRCIWENIVLWGLYSGPPILGNYHIYIYIYIYISLSLSLSPSLSTSTIILVIRAPAKGPDSWQSAFRT